MGAKVEVTTAATSFVSLPEAVLKRSLTHDASLAFAVQTVARIAVANFAVAATIWVVANFVVATIWVGANFAVAKLHLGLVGGEKRKLVPPR
jgi:hypothetical protein